MSIALGTSVSRTESEHFFRARIPSAASTVTTVSGERVRLVELAQTHGTFPIQFDRCSGFIGGYFRMKKSQREIERGISGREMSEGRMPSSAVVNG